MSTAGTHTRSWIAGYDGLRALACLAVFGVHFGDYAKVQGGRAPFDLAHALDNGNTGVAYFFMLSAFLLSVPLWRGRSFRLGSYVLRRAVRIGPAYFACLTAMVLVSGVGGLDALLHYAFVHNLHEPSVYSISEQFWTIAVQVQFYALFPLLVLVWWPVRVSRSASVGLFLLLSAGAYFAHAWLMNWSNTVTDWPINPRWIARADEGMALEHSVLAHLPHFLLGIAMGGVYASLADRANADARKRSLPACDVLVWLAIAAVTAILVIKPLDEALQTPFGRYNWPYVPVLIAVVIVCTPFALTAPRVLDWAPLRGLGRVSYGFYIYHVACMRLVMKLMGRAELDVTTHKWTFFAASLAVSIVVSVGSYYLLERPILRAAKRFSNWRAGATTRAKPA